jgi:outer membrane protein TolC
VQSSNYNIGVAKAAYFPTLRLSASGGYSGAQLLADLITLPYKSWSAGLSTALNIFDGGAISANISSSEQGYLNAVYTYRQTVLDAFKETYNYLMKLNALTEQEKLQAQALQNAKEALKIAENQYKEGLTPYSTLLQQQTSTLSTEKSYLNIKHNLLLNWVNLVGASGGNLNGAE